MTTFTHATGAEVVHVDGDGLILFTLFDLPSGAILAHGQASSLDIAKLQERTQGAAAPETSFVLGWWDAARYRVVDGEPQEIN